MKINNLNVCPSSLKEGFETYSQEASIALFGAEDVNPVLDFHLSPEVYSYDKKAAGMSISGVQEKFPAVIDGGRIRVADEGERSTHILKPFPGDLHLRERRDIPANEHLTMQIASQVYGIRTAANGICVDAKGNPVYITRRFDILPDGQRLQMEDFASITGRNEESAGSRVFKYTGAYTEIAHAIKRYIPSWMVEMEKFFKLLVFNYIYANGDAHLKNFSVINQGDELLLAPAYDLINTALHINDSNFALEGGLGTMKSDTCELTGHPARKDFETFGLAVGLVKKRVDKILESFMYLPEDSLSLLSNSFLSDKSKRSYRRIVSERIARFRRE